MLAPEGRATGHEPLPLPVPPEDLLPADAEEVRLERTRFEVGETMLMIEAAITRLERALAADGCYLGGLALARRSRAASPSSSSVAIAASAYFCRRSASADRSHAFR